MALRIAVVCEYATLNGGENSMLAAVGELSTDRFECVFLAPSEGRLADALSRRGLEHVPLSLHDGEGRRLPRESACARIRDTVGCARPDLVHANSLSMGRLTGSMAGELEVPTVAHLRDIVGLSGGAIADLNRNRRLLAVSRATRDFHVAAGLDGTKVQVLHNGVDCERFRPRAAGRLRDELGLAPETFLAATVGQIGLRKGQDVLAEAAASLADELPDVHYLLVGERNSRKLESVRFEKEVVEAFRGAEMIDRLHRLGYRDDVARLMNEVDLLVHPARQEPLGRVLLEAAAAGLPVVATDVGGTAEIFEDGETARLVPAGDAASLAAAIVQLYRDADLRRRFSAAARERVCREFSLTKAAEGLAEVWGDVLADRG